MKEQRRFIRFKISLKINYILQKEPKEEKKGMTKDVSAGGIQLLTPEKLEPGARVELKIFVPNALNPVHMRGTVLWAKEITTSQGIHHANGIEFVDVEEDNKNTFLSFLCDLMYKKIGTSA